MAQGLGFFQTVCLLLSLFCVVRFCDFLRLTQHRWQRNWWQLYKERRETRDFDFVPTGVLCSFRLSQYEIDRSLCLSNEKNTHAVEMTRPLLRDEIHLRVAHQCDGNTAHGHIVSRVCCIGCRALLPTSAFFVACHYWCVECIVGEMLPRFCGERLWLLKETGLVPYDLALLVVKYVAHLSFSHSDIVKIWDGDHCPCSSPEKYHCQSKEEKRELHKQLAQYLKLHNKLLPL